MKIWEHVYLEVIIASFNEDGWSKRLCGIGFLNHNSFIKPLLLRHSSSAGLATLSPTKFSTVSSYWMALHSCPRVD